VFLDAEPLQFHAVTIVLVLQGSVATKLSYGGKFFIVVMSHFFLIQTLKEFKQESPAIADKPAQRESLSKIAPIRRAYNVVADNTGLSSFV